MHNIAPKGPKSHSPGLPRSGYPGLEKRATAQTPKGNAVKHFPPASYGV
jgi:hypothetical protein